MASIKRINTLLHKHFGSGINAQRQRNHLQLTGRLSDWGQVVAAGQLAAKYNPLPSVVNDIEFTATETPPIPESTWLGDRSSRNDRSDRNCRSDRSDHNSQSDRSDRNSQSDRGDCNSRSDWSDRNSRSDQSDQSDHNNQSDQRSRCNSDKNDNSNRYLAEQRCDVLIIGGGVTGCAVARALSRYRLDVVLVDKECDVALHASSRNDGMIHPGIDLKKRSDKYRYNREGNAMYDRLCHELGVAFRRCGQYVCFNKKWIKPLLYLTLPRWKWMGIPAAVMNRKKLRSAEPHLAEDIHAALFFPTAGIVCPYGLTIALAENAVQNGVKLSLDTAVQGMEVRDIPNTQDTYITAVHTNRGTICPRVVVNAAGVFAEDIARYAKDHFYSIHPRRGTNAILDKKYTNRITNSIVASFATAATKTEHTKGGGIVTTVHGNLLVGPDARETWEKEDFTTSRESVNATFEKQSRTAPALGTDKIITYFTGVRAPTYEEDFVVTPGWYTKNIVHAAGIQSPGLTAAPAIGDAVARMVVALLEKDAPVAANPNYNPVRTPIPHTAAMPTVARAELIRHAPDYGEIVCRCEEISRGEIVEALRRPVPCRTVDGVKRRVRPGMGRCQGGFCGPLVARIIAEELGIPLTEVLKSGEGSRLLYGANKAALKGDAPL